MKDSTCRNECNPGINYPKTCDGTECGETINLEANKENMSQSLKPLKPDAVCLKLTQIKDSSKEVSLNNPKKSLEKKLKCCNSILAFHSPSTSITKSLSDTVDLSCSGNTLKTNDIDDKIKDNTTPDSIKVFPEEKESIEETNTEDMLTQVNPNLSEFKESSSCEKSDYRQEESKCVTENINGIHFTNTKISGNKSDDKATDMVNILPENSGSVEINNQINAKEMLKNHNSSEFKELLSKSSDNQLKESKCVSENISDFTVTYSSENHYYNKEAELVLDKNFQSDVVISILPESVQNNEINNQTNKEDILCQKNAKLDEAEEFSPEGGEGQNKVCEINYYSEHQDILDSIDSILSEGQEDKIDTFKKHSKVSNRSGGICMLDSVFEGKQSQEKEPCHFDFMKPTEITLLNICANIADKTESSLNEDDLREEICDNEEKTSQENSCEQNGVESDYDEPQTLTLQDSQISSKKMDAVIVSEAEFDFIEKVIENDQVKQTKFMEREEQIIEDTADDKDFSSLMISHSQLLEIENTCFNGNTSNIDKIEEKTFILTNKPPKTRSVYTQTDSLNNPFSLQQTSSIFESKSALWAAKNRERQKKLRDAVQEVERLK